MGDVAEADALAESQRGAIAAALVTVPKIVAPSGVVLRGRPSFVVRSRLPAPGFKLNAA
jgi:hypothetical protein